MAHAHHKTDSHTVSFQVDPVVLELGQRFVDAGHELSLVGGPVRDLFLGRISPDLDFTTDATPDQTVALIKKWADNYWEIGRAFGTIGMRKGGFQIEITTYRADAYDPESRKPVVAFGTSLTDDLLRRDFTINAMALRLPMLELVDPFGGVRDLHASILNTPGPPETSFSDDPLRMMRAARFAAQLGVSAARRGPRGHGPDGRTDQHHLGRTRARRTGQAHLRRAAAGRRGPAGGHGTRGPRAARSLGPAPRIR